MPEAPPAPPPPTRDLSKTPTLLETVAAQFDITGAPTITARQLPSPVKSDGEPIQREEKKEKAEAEASPKKEEKPKPTDGEDAAQQEAAWKKAGEAVADKLFRKKAKAAQPEKKEEAVKKADEPPAPAKPTEEKPKPTTRRRASEAEITERAAAAAAEAATKAVSKMARTESPPAPAKPADPAESLSTAERKQFVVYQELESSQPDRYKGITGRYLSSLKDTQDYVKTWAKEHPGESFNPDEEEHDAFFERVEPQVDEDDWVDAKANIRAREISSKAIAPVNEKLEEMERERARQTLEPLVHHRQLEAVHMLLNEFDPTVVEAIRKPDGLKELSDKDPITATILGKMANRIGSMAAEIVRLEDPKAGINFDPRSDVHRELADFIIGQERRIAALPVDDRMHEGKPFIGRQQLMAIPPEERANYWHLTAEHVIYLLAQKFAMEAKKTRDAGIAEFNATAERLGYKKIDSGKPASEKAPVKETEPPKPKTTLQSPESISKTSVRTIPGGDGKPALSESEAIVAKLFHTLKS